MAKQLWSHLCDLKATLTDGLPSTARRRAANRNRVSWTAHEILLPAPVIITVPYPLTTPLVLEMLNLAGHRTWNTIVADIFPDDDVGYDAIFFYRGKSGIVLVKSSRTSTPQSIISINVD